MKKQLMLLGTVCSALLLTGCSIKQEVRSAKNLQSKEVCIVKNEKVRESFLESYTNALEKKNYNVKVMDLHAARECKVKSTYTANWLWDLALYMAYTKITVYKDNDIAGEAVYDSLAGGGNMSKFINADNKIHELVSELYP